MCSFSFSGAQKDTKRFQQYISLQYAGKESVIRVGTSGSMRSGGLELKKMNGMELVCASSFLQLEVRYWSRKLPAFGTTSHACRNRTNPRANGRATSLLSPSELSVVVIIDTATMSQYKQSMERMSRLMEGGDQQAEDEHKVDKVKALSDSEANNDQMDNEDPHDISAVLSHPALAYLQRHADFILMPLLPLAWCLLLVATLTRDEMLSAWGMPLLGIGSATLANAVPVGGGIVFVPILHLFGYEIKLGTAFAVATMTFGNGVFGLLNWIKKDISAIAFYAIPAAVIPAWIGAAIGTLRPFMTPEHCKTLFALFALKVAAVIWRGLYVGRRNVRLGKPFTIGFGLDDNQAAADLARRKRSTHYIASICSFLAGLVLVAHIGVGNALVSFLVFAFVWRLEPKQAMVTAVICGGWTSFCPFLIHLFILKDIPIALWIMTLPGVFLGAKIAPKVHEIIGIVNVLAAFVIFLLLVAVSMVS